MARHVLTFGLSSVERVVLRSSPIREEVAKQDMSMSNSPVSEKYSARELNLELETPSQEELDKLSRSVAALHVEMAQRISREEGPGGFFAFVSLAAPRYVSFLETLRAEHHRLLGALTSLRVKIARATPDHWDALLAETDACLSAIEEHEELEREVLRDALEP